MDDDAKVGAARGTTPDDTAAAIEAKIAALDDWRGAALARIRALVLAAVPGVEEAVKWRGVPTWSRDGILLTGEVYRDKVKTTFAQGASLPDPKGLFNASLDGGTRRAIDVGEGDRIDAVAFKALVRAAAKHNAAAIAAKSSKTKIATKATKATPAAKPTRRAPARAGVAPPSEPKLLSGGNPQIPKGYGDAPVQAWIAAVPGWQRDVARRVDALVVRALPKVEKAVKWNSPLYGAGDGWIISLHVYAKYLKVAFFRGARLDPPPPGASKQADVRYLDIREGEPLDEKRFVAWVKQAAKLPGERM